MRAKFLVDDPDRPLLDARGPGQRRLLPVQRRGVDDHRRGDGSRRRALHLMRAALAALALCLAAPGRCARRTRCPSSSRPTTSRWRCWSWRRWGRRTSCSTSARATGASSSWRRGASARAAWAWRSCRSWCSAAARNAAQAGVAERAHFVEQDLFKTDLSHGHGHHHVPAAGGEPAAAPGAAGAEAGHAHRLARLGHGRLAARPQPSRWTRPTSRWAATSAAGCTCGWCRRGPTAPGAAAARIATRGCSWRRSIRSSTPRCRWARRTAAGRAHRRPAAARRRRLRCGARRRPAAHHAARRCAGRAWPAPNSSAARLSRSARSWRSAAAIRSAAKRGSICWYCHAISRTARASSSTLCGRCRRGTEQAGDQAPQRHEGGGRGARATGVVRRHAGAT